MILELNDLHNKGSQAQRTIEVKDGEIDTYHHEDGFIIVSANGSSHLISNAFQFLLIKYRQQPLFKEFVNFWKVGYIMNDEGKTIKPLRPDFHNEHSPVGLEKVIDHEFMTKRWRHNPNLFFTLDDLAQTLRGLYNLDGSLLFDEYGESCWEGNLDGWITQQIIEGCQRVVRGHQNSYGESAISSTLAQFNKNREAAGLRAITRDELFDGDYSFLDTESAASPEPTVTSNGEARPADPEGESTVR